MAAAVLPNSYVPSKTQNVAIPATFAITKIDIGWYTVYFVAEFRSCNLLFSKTQNVTTQTNHNISQLQNAMNFFTPKGTCPHNIDHKIHTEIRAQ